jgi:hypothetical protein
VCSEGSPGVSITGLPGREPGAALKFKAFSLLSNGEQKINMGDQQQELTFHKIFKVRPISFSGGDKYFEMAGIIDLSIPRIEAGSGIISSQSQLRISYSRSSRSMSASRDPAE